jgi:hypothetical protein
MGGGQFWGVRMAVVIKEKKSGKPKIVYRIAMMNTSSVKGALQNEPNVEDVDHQREVILCAQGFEREHQGGMRTPEEGVIRDSKGQHKVMHALTQTS